MSFFAQTHFREAGEADKCVGAVSIRLHSPGRADITAHRRNTNLPFRKTRRKK